MSIQDGIPEKGSLLDDINEFGRLVNDLAVSLGKEPTCKPITLKPITTKVAKMRNLLAEIDVPLHYAGEHWITVRVYGEWDRDEGGKLMLSDMRCEVNDSPADWLPESLQQTIAEEIIRGDHN